MCPYGSRIMTARLLRTYLDQHFNLILLTAAGLAFGLGMWSGLGTRFAGVALNSAGWLPDAAFSLLAVLAVGFPIYAVHRTAHLRMLQRQRDAVAARAHFAARHDGLTGLCNRLFMHEVIEGHDGAVGSGFALILIDLDHFSPVNDLRGHDIGDQVLIEVAKRLKGICPSDAILGRLGGDEFAILIPTVGDTGDMALIAQDVVDTIARPIHISNFTIALSASCGVAHWAPDMKITDLLVHAVQALNAAKKGGRAGYRFFDAKIGQILKEDALLQADLIDAVVNDGFYCVFQPYFEIAGGRLAGAEVLARWQHPTFGHVPPERFIKMADKLGLIDKLSDQLLEKACAEAADWPADLMLSFNVTPSQFSDPHLVSRILRVLERYDRHCSRFEVELTEHSLLSDEPRARTLMRELIEAGVHIALDDFGTGSSSLSLLTTYPFRRLKIDRSFVQDLHIDPVNAAITKGVADLAHALNMHVTAEGVEHPEELKAIQALTPIHVQGYLLGRPMTADALNEVIASHAGPDGAERMRA